MRSCQPFPLNLALSLLLLLPVSSTRAFQADKGIRSSKPDPASNPKTTPIRSVSADQHSVARLAEQSGVMADWHARLGVPFSIRGRALGQRHDYSGGKGLATQQGQHGQNAIAVMDNLSRFYRLRDAESELAVKSVEQDSLGFSHVRLTQRHGNLRVVGGDLIVHFDQDGEAYEANGLYVPDLDPDTTAKIESDEAVRIAAEDLLKIERLDGGLAREPELVIFAFEADPQPAYELILLTQDAQGSPGRWRYWVNAADGSILLHYNDIKKIAPPTANGSNASISGGILAGEGGQTASVVGWRENTGYHYLYSTNRHWLVYNVAASGYPDANTYAHRTNANWDASDRVEMSTARNFDFVQRYFLEMHGRNSFNGAGLFARANVHKDINYVNAYWDGTAFYFGDGDGMDANPLSTLDICGHEYAHAVTEYSADLIYAYEAGALNESFSDIFGTCIEFYAQPDGRSQYPAKLPGTADWLCGEDSWLSSVALRDIRNPRNTATVGAGNEQPSRYRGTYWYSGTGDNGGVHINSGVQNFFFYLLCEGGSGNNNGINYSVAGIGITNAGRVAYRALTVYCTPSTDFQAARSAWLSAAMDLNTNWMASVGAAWSAVGVGALQVSPATTLTFRGPVGGPFSPTTQTATLSNRGGTPMNWAVTMPQGWLAVSPVGGMIPANGSNSITVSVQPGAASLPAGIYTNSLSFSNNVDGMLMSREAALLVGQPNFFVEQFSESDNDMDYQTWTFTPDGSPDHYAVCREPAAAFPTDPNGGTAVTLTDDSYAAITLPGNNTVAIYNRRTNTFFIGSNGYLTMNQGDSSLSETLSDHFNLPRVSACFDDLNPASGGTVSWKQTGELVAVTFSNVPEYGTTATVNFQIELFYDGRIRLTYLGIGITDGLAGLSGGQGLPIGFAETDLTSLPACSPPDVLIILPVSGFASQGVPGGPFSPAASSYVLSNASPAGIQWAAWNSQPWVNVAPTNGAISSGQTATVAVSLTTNANSLPGGQHADRVFFSNLTTRVTQQRSVTLTAQVPPPNLAEASDTPGWTWTTGGAQGWTGQTVVTHDGIDAAQSGAIGHSQETWMQTTVQGPGTLTFWWRVSSESGFDYLELRTNGALAMSISGDVNWTPASISIASGTQTIRWRYVKDGSVNSGQDRGWVDEVGYVPLIGSLHHFSWGPIASPQQDQIPFAAILTARDGLNGPVTNFNGWVDLSASIVRTNTIGSNATAMNFPMGTYYHDERTQIIYQPGELSGVGRITALALDVATRPGQILNAFTIRMKHSSLRGYTNYLWEGAGWTTVYQTTVNVSSSGWVTFTLATPFIYNGVDSLMVDFSFNNSSYSSDGLCRATARTGVRTLYYRTDSYNGDPLTWSGSVPYPSTSSYTPNLRLFTEGVLAVPIEPSVVCLTNGTWNGALTLRMPATDLNLVARDSQGHVGYSNPFRVMPTAPIIATHPTNLTVTAGDSATFCANAIGSSPLYCFWFRNGVPIAGAIQSCLTLNNIQFPDSGSGFSCLFSNAHGTATSTVALLRVNRRPIADASATPTMLIAPDSLSTRAILDGSRSSDPDGDQLRFLWYENPSTIPLATGTVAVVSLPVGVHTLDLVVGDGMVTDTNHVSISILTPEQAILALKQTVEHSQRRPVGQYLAILDAAIAAVARGNVTAAINQLHAFQLMVRAQIMPDDRALAETWIHAAQQIMDSLCSEGVAGIPPRIHIIHQQAGGKLRFKMQAAACWLHVVEASSNLTDWEVIGVPTVQTNGTFDFEDPNASKHPERFYRIKQLPR